MWFAFGARCKTTIASSFCSKRETASQEGVIAVMIKVYRYNPATSCGTWLDGVELAKYADALQSSEEPEELRSGS